MAEQPLQCEVITPEAKAFEGRADAVVIPAHDGEIGILKHRAPLVCKLGAGRLAIRRGDEEENWFIDGGFAQVLNNRVVILTQKARRAREIDLAEAEALLSEASEMKVTDDITCRRKEQAEASARARIRIAGRPESPHH